MIESTEGMVEALHEQRDWLRVTLSSIGDAVITTDTHGSVTFLNPVAQALTGWTQEDAAGQPLEKILRALIRNPPSVFVAVPALFSQSEPPLDTRIRFSAATRFNSPSVGAF